MFEVFAKIYANDGSIIRVSRTMDFSEVQMFFLQNQCDDLRSWKGGERYNSTWMNTNGNRSFIQVIKIQ